MASWRDRVLRIDVTFDDDEAQGGTGFVVGEDLVLTALHVIHPRRGVDRRRDVRRVLVHATPGAEPVAATRIWPKDEDLTRDAVDAAVLRVPLPAWLQPGLELDPTWVEGATYESAGYPTTRCGNQIPVRGRLGRAASESGVRLVTVDESAKPDYSKLWGGLSGGPLCQGGRSVGIIIQREHEWTGLLHAVAMSDVFAAPGFRDAVPAPTIPGELRDRLDRILGTGPRKALASVLSVAPEDVVERLLTHDLEAVAKGLCDTHAKLFPDPALRADASRIYAAVCVLVAARAPKSRTQDDGACGVEVAGKAGLDAVVAREQGRDLLLGDAGVSDSSGRDLLPMPKDDPVQMASSVREELRRKLDLEEDVTSDEDLAAILHAHRDEHDSVRGLWYHFAWTEDPDRPSALSDVLPQLTNFYRGVFFRQLTTTDPRWRAIAVHLTKMHKRQTDLESGQASS